MNPDGRLRRIFARIALLAILAMFAFAVTGATAQAQNFNINTDCGELTPQTGALAPLAPVLGDPTKTVCDAIRTMGWVDKGKQLAIELLLGILAIEFVFMGVQYGLFKEDFAELLGSITFRVFISAMLCGIIANADGIFGSIIRSNYSGGSFHGGFEGVAGNLSHTSRDDVAYVISLYTGTAVGLSIFAGQAHLADVTDPTLFGDSAVAGGNGFLATGSALSFGSLHALDIQVMYLLCGLLLLGALIIYLQYVLLTIESLIVIFGGIMFIGFAGWTQTTQFARGYMQYAISNGVKLLVFYLVLSILKGMLPAVVGLSLASGAAIAFARGPLIILADAATFTLAITFFQALIGALLAWFIPNFAGSFITGNPAVGISDVVGSLQSTIGGMSSIAAGVKASFDAASSKKQLEANRGALTGHDTPGSGGVAPDLNTGTNKNGSTPLGAVAAVDEKPPSEMRAIPAPATPDSSGFVSGRGNGAIGYNAYTAPAAASQGSKPSGDADAAPGAAAAVTESVRANTRKVIYQQNSVMHVYRKHAQSLEGGESGGDDGGADDGTGPGTAQPSASGAADGAGSAAEVAGSAVGPSAGNGSPAGGGSASGGSASGSSGVNAGAASSPAASAATVDSAVGFTAPGVSAPISASSGGSSSRARGVAGSGAPSTDDGSMSSGLGVPGSTASAVPVPGTDAPAIAASAVAASSVAPGAIPSAFQPVPSGDLHDSNLLSSPGVSDAATAGSADFPASSGRAGTSGSAAPASPPISAAPQGSASAGRFAAAGTSMPIAAPASVPYAGAPGAAADASARRSDEHARPEETMPASIPTSYSDSAASAQPASSLPAASVSPPAPANVSSIAPANATSIDPSPAVPSPASSSFVTMSDARVTDAKTTSAPAPFESTFAPAASVPASGASAADAPAQDARPAPTFGFKPFPIVGPAAPASAMPAASAGSAGSTADRPVRALDRDVQSPKPAPSPSDATGARPSPSSARFSSGSSLSRFGAAAHDDESRAEGELPE